MASKKMATKLFSHLGDPATYTPKDSGMPINTTAIIHTDVNAAGGFESVITITETHVSLPKVDVAKPRKGDKIAVNGERYFVEDLAPAGNTGEMVRVIVK